MTSLRAHELFATARTAPGPAGSFVALAVFVFLLYANLAMWIPVLDAVRPAQLSIAAAVALLILESTSARVGLKLIWPEGHLLLLFLLLSTLSAPTALWPRLGFESALDLGKCITVYFLISQTVDRTSRLKTLMWTMVVGGFFPALGTLLFYERGLTSQGRASWVGIFGNPNDAAYALVLLFPLALGLAARSSAKGRLLAGVAAVAYLAAIYTTYSRGGILGLLAVVVVMGVQVRSAVLRVVGGLLLVVTTVAALHFWNRQDGFTELGTDATVNQRIITVKAGFSMLADYPLLGVGLGCSVVGFERYVEPGVLTGKSLVVHNTFVQALAETGLLGGLVYIVLIFGAILGAHRMASARAGSAADASERAVLAGALVASLVGFAVCGLSSGQVLSWFPYILLGLVSACRRLETSERGGSLEEAA